MMMIVAEFRHGLALAALKHNHGFSFGIPLPSVHG
jgi:hypothetical protein